MSKHRGIAAFTLATLHLGCGAHDPSDPASTPPSFRSSTETPGALRTQNAAPALVVVTSPSADGGTISGTPPLTVSFNLCRSGDSDQGDSLNWQFNFGDSGKAAFNADGTFNRDVDQVCRVEHTYAEGIYTAWVSVTDKHLEDQSRGVSALARRSQSFTIRAERAPEPPALPPPVTTPALPYCHSLPSWCPGQQQFCEATPISSSNASQAQDACNACYGITSCADTSYYNGARGFVAHGITMFVYVPQWPSPFGSPSFCTTQGYIWRFAAADIADLTNHCGAGFW